MLTTAVINAYTRYELRQGAIFVFTDGLDTASRYPFSMISGIIQGSALK